MPARANDLESNPSTVVGLGLVHDTHPAGADLPDDPVPPNPRLLTKADDRSARTQHGVPDRCGNPLAVRGFELDELIEPGAGSPPQRLERCVNAIGEIRAVITHGHPPPGSNR